MHRFILLLLVAPAAFAAEPKRDGKNLIPNGDFEEGTTSPAHWQTVDGLTAFYVKDADPKHNKCIKFDTDVLQSQGYEWWAKFARAEALRATFRTIGQPLWGAGVVPPQAKDAPKKLPTVEPKYDTLAGNDGVWFWSDFFPVERGKAYWLSLDAKGPGMMCWLVGYPEKYEPFFGSDAKALIGYLKDEALPNAAKQKRGHEAQIARYVYRGQLTVGASKEWQTFSRKEKLFRPTSMTPEVKFCRILLLPFWPAGEYHVDNVRLVEVPDPEKRKDGE
jgi:hypothetical protein